MGIGADAGSGLKIPRSGIFFPKTSKSNCDFLITFALLFHSDISGKLFILSHRYPASRWNSFGFVQYFLLSFIFRISVLFIYNKQCLCIIFIMIHYTFCKKPESLSSDEEAQVLEFLFKHLEQYGDARPDIQKCLDYASGRDNKPGGIILTAKEEEEMVGAAIINFTGMNGYIPENILVYIATHSDYRGRGIGKTLMEMIIAHTDGNIALHVEPNNPAKTLYEKMGFTNKYLEMRLNK